MQKQYELCFRAMAMFHMLGKSTFISIEDSKAFKNKMNQITNKLIQKQFDVRLQYILNNSKYFNFFTLLQLIEEEIGGNKVDG